METVCLSVRRVVKIKKIHLFWILFATIGLVIATDLAVSNIIIKKELYDTIEVNSTFKYTVEDYDNGLNKLCVQLNGKTIGCKLSVDSKNYDNTEKYLIERYLSMKKRGKTPISKSIGDIVVVKEK